MKSLIAGVFAAALPAAYGGLHFDTNTAVKANGGNYWPFADAGNQAYQLWLSQGILSGFTGEIHSISHFIADGFDAGGPLSWTMDVYLSSGAADKAKLKTGNMIRNHGDDRTKVFSGSAALVGKTLTINLDKSFDYSGGNLLIEYDFYRFGGAGPAYSGPVWQAVNDNAFIYRVTHHAQEGKGIYNWGALRTEFNAAPVSETESGLLLAIGLGALVLKRRYRLH